MREITFMYGNGEKGWKYYHCTEKETIQGKERKIAYGFDGNMCYWTYPYENINTERKCPIPIKEIPFGMDFTKCNFKKIIKKINNIVKNMPEENFPENFRKTRYFWQLLIENNNMEKTGIYSATVKNN